MAWNQPSEDDKLRARTGSTAGKGLEETLRRWQRRFDSLGGGGGSRRVAATLLVIAACAWAATGLYRIQPTERALVLRFDRVVAELGPGTGLRWPWPIESVQVFDVDTPQTLDYQASELTAEVAMADVHCTLQYLQADPRKLLAAGPDAGERVRAAGELALRETIGATGLAVLLHPERRAGLGQAVRERAQQLLDAADLGVRISAAQVTDVQMPPAVQPAQRELAKVQAERATALDAARAYAAAMLPKAKTDAEQLLLEAETARAQAAATAEADAARFSALVPAYQQAPEVTRQRLYIETMESILSHARKIVIDTRAGAGASMIYLPLDKLIESGTRLPPVGGGAAGVQAPAATAPTAPAISAPAIAAPATAAPAGAASMTGEEPERSRERDQRLRESR
jgi:membrane protease subunit HflK